MLTFRRFLNVPLLAALVTVLQVNAGEAGFTTFFGQDLAANKGQDFMGVAVGDNALDPGDMTTTGTTNSLDAYDAFLNALGGADVGVEDFESFTGINPFGQSATSLSLDLEFERISPNVGTLSVEADLEGMGLVAKLDVSETDPAKRDNEAGRYPVTQRFGGDQYLSTNFEQLAFTITFSEPIAAFGFFGTDFGDFNGEIELIINGDSSNKITIPHPKTSPPTTTNSGGFVVENFLNSNLLFFGLVGTNDMTISSVSFNNKGTGSFDRFGFDNLVVATSPIPEPSTLALFGLGTIGLAVGRLRRRRSKLEA